MRFTLDGESVSCAPGDSYLEALSAARPEKLKEILGIGVGGLTLSLLSPATEGAEAVSLTVYTEEGRRIYERTLRFVLLIAFGEICPGAKLRVENSTHLGLYITVFGARANAELAEKLDARMRALTRAALPISLVPSTRKEAMAYFAATGQADKLRLLGYRPYEHFSMYECGGLKEYFYGEMAPATDYVPVFRLRYRMPGLELQLPDPADPRKVSAVEDDPKLTRAFAETTRWAEILNCSNIADLNEMIEKRRLREFIRVNEALHEKSIAKIAEKFIESGARLILIAGPSSSGKTTFAHRLSIQLRASGLRPMKLSMDDYYLDRDQIPDEPDGRKDFERVETLDTERFNRDLVALLEGERVETPLFDFTVGRRSEKTRSQQLEAGQPVIVEGIHALNPLLTHDVPRPQKYQIFISALTTMNLDDHNRIRTTDVRLLRRIVRDYQFRGTAPEGTMDMWDSVKRGERNYIFPCLRYADTVFNSTLQYELAVLKKYVYPMLIRVPAESPHYTRAHRLTKFLNYVQAAEVEDEIPPNSILREFIGGCCFYREDD